MKINLIRMTATAALFASLLTLSGCAASKYRYHIDQDSTPAGMIDGSGAYSDDFVSISVSEEVGPFGSNLIGFKLNVANKANETIKIDWNEATLIDPSGKLSPLVTGEVRFIDIEKAIKPTVIPKGLVLTEVVFPAKNAYYNSLSKSYDFQSMGFVVNDSLRGRKAVINLPVEGQSFGKREYSLTVNFVYQ